MSLIYENIRVESPFGVTVSHSYTRQSDAADKLLIMLPGRGYTCENPLLFYLRSMALQNGWDVLSVQYGFQVNGAELNSQNMPYALTDVNNAADPVLANGYKRICIAGKSMGTPLANALAHRITDASVSLLQLTPIPGAVEVSETLPTLAIIGTADPMYSAEVVAAFANHATVSWKVFDGLNHSMEQKGDWQASLAILPQIIAQCEAFLKP